MLLISNGSSMFILVKFFKYDLVKRIFELKFKKRSGDCEVNEIDFAQSQADFIFPIIVR